MSSAPVPSAADLGAPDPSVPDSAAVAPAAPPLPVLEFVAPLPGFPSALRFFLVEVHDSGLLYSLTSVDYPGLRFLVAPPAPFFADYAPEVDDETLAALGTTEPADLLVLLVVSTGQAASEATVNLLAPIVVDQHTRRAVQLVLNGSDLPVREPLLIPRGGPSASEKQVLGAQNTIDSEK